MSVMFMLWKTAYGRYFGKKTHTLDTVSLSRTVRLKRVGKSVNIFAETVLDECSRPVRVEIPIRSPATRVPDASDIHSAPTMARSEGGEVLPKGFKPEQMLDGRLAPAVTNEIYLAPAMRAMVMIGQRTGQPILEVTLE